MSNKQLTLGSLFSGSGGFELAGILAGMRPMWNSDIEPFAVRVTTMRLPDVKHYGDVSTLKGGEMEPVDVITFGSPCQDLSIAGKRAGIHDGERSNLFFQAIRIIKEMRAATNNQYPRFCVWENVCFDADTLVTCEDGYRRIADVSVGQKVKTLSGKYLPVMKVHQTKKQEVIRLRVQGSEEIIVTPNHPFYAMRKIRGKKRNGILGLSGPEWVPAGELTKDHLVAFCMDHPTLPEDFISEAEAWAVGRWIADGSVDLTKSNPRMFFSIGIGKEELAREMLGRLPYAIYENKPHPTATNFCFTSKEFYALIADAGKGAGNKRVPPYVFQLPMNLQKAVLDGYVSGDGHIRVRDCGRELCAATASRELAYGVARLIRNVYHVAAGLSVRDIKCGNIQGREIVANYPSYQVTAYLDSKSQQTHIDGTIVWQPVKSIERLDEKRTVYNLSVWEDNTYAANEVIVHNCGAFTSNAGEDFKAVLDAIVGIVEENAPSVPSPEKGRWPSADVLVGDGWSIAYRVLDSQFWGVPQRRKRIFLVGDLAGGRAGDILSVSESLSGYSPEGFRAWQRAANGAQAGAGEASRGIPVINPQGCSGISITEDVTATLVAQDHGHHPVVLGEPVKAAGFLTEN
ncbi:MAG: DNA cytosine methyltransferase, partial [Eubacteriales bacterium]|nr:DNA cytosine methyltransferase [Eubacteriales bacterium]